MKSGNDQHQLASAGKLMNFGKGATQWENYFAN
jgi:hypothetical protein